MSKIFKFSIFYNVMFGIIFLQIMIIFIGTVACLEGGIYAALFVFLVGFPFVCISGMLALINILDVVIGDDGITKKFLGRTIIHISWDNVRRIDCITRTFTPSDGGKSRPLSYLHVWPIRRFGILILSGGKMIFSSQMAGFGEFIEIINNYNSKYKFKMNNLV